MDVANNEMARALRVVSVERGVHPASARPLIAFGGAGPLHACEVADLLGTGRVIAPACAGVLAALGTVIAGERRDWVQTVLVPAPTPTDSRVPSRPLMSAPATLPGPGSRSRRRLPLRRPGARADGAVGSGPI